MKKTIASFFQKANECLIDAEILLAENRYEGSCNRAYYAFFDAVRALLATKEVTTKTHSGTHNLFNLHFIKSGIFPLEISGDLNNLFEKRQGGYYDLDIELTKQDAETSLAIAKKSLLQTKDYLMQGGFLS